MKPLDLRFRAGETLSYTIRVLGALAGRSRMAVFPERRYKGHRVVPLVGKMQTAGVIAKMFKLLVDQESLVDRRSLMPHFVGIDVEKQAVKRDFAFFFNQRRGRVYSLLKERGRLKKKYWTAIPSLTLDNLAAIYWLRCQPLKLNSRLQFGLYMGRRAYQINCQVKKRALVSTPLGTFHTLALYGESRRWVAPSKKKVIVKPGKSGAIPGKVLTRFWVYFTDDYKRIPVKAVFLSKYGPGEAVLDKVEIKRYK